MPVCVSGREGVLRGSAPADIELRGLNGPSDNEVHKEATEAVKENAQDA